MFNLFDPLPTALAAFPGKESVIRIMQAALAAANPYEAVKKKLTILGDTLFIGDNTYHLENIQSIYLLSVGKASLGMAQAVIEVFGDRLAKGLVVHKTIPQNLPPGFDNIEITQGNHPIPGPGSIESAEQAIQLLEQAGETDLVVCTISGGSSSLIAWPKPGIDLDDLQIFTGQLLACGADIREINILRKHLDQVKGGGLAQAAAPSRLVGLILSDVVGNPLDIIASGPTVPDPSTYKAAMGVINKYDLRKIMPASIWQLLESGVNGLIPETFKPGDPAFRRVENVLVGSNLQSIESAVAQAKKDGWNSSFVTTSLQGEARQAGGWLAKIAQQIDLMATPLTRPACMIAGGETTVTMAGNGKGGRNQEVALGAVEGLNGLSNTLLVTLGTDGEDGPTDAAGAVVDGTTYQRALSMGIDFREFLHNNDAYHYFQALEDLIVTGPTGTNVNDISFLFLS